MKITQSGLSIASASEIGPARNLTAWYPLVGDTRDYAGTNDAVNNGATAIADGYLFNGSTSFLDVGNTDHFNILQNLTISAWIQLNSLDNWKRIWMRSSHDQYQMDISSGRLLRMEVWNQAGVRHRVHSTTVLQNHQWYHCVTSVNTKEQLIRLYVNGVQEDSQSWQGPIVSKSGATVNIGRDVRGSSTTYLDGIIRDLRIYNRELDSKEVAVLFNISNYEGSKTSITGDCIYTKGYIKELTM